MRKEPIDVLETPVNAAQLMAVAAEVFLLPENKFVKHSKPRASGIGSCARQQAYSMAATPITNPSAPDNPLTTEQGRIMDAEITQRLIMANDLFVTNTQISLPDSFPMTGHPDGELATLFDGLKWGYEHKHLGRWGYEKVFKDGFEVGEPGYLCQTVAYGMALGWDAALIVCLAQDASSTRSDANQNLSAKNPRVRWANQPDWNPKMLVYGIDLRPYYPTLGKRLTERAEWLTAWHTSNGVPSTVAREADPEAKTHTDYKVDGAGNITVEQGPEFPCGWCPWLNQCLADGAGGVAAPELPFKLQESRD